MVLESEGKRGERAKAEKVRGAQAEQAKTEAFNTYLEQQIRGAS